MSESGEWKKKRSLLTKMMNMRAKRHQPVRVDDDETELPTAEQTITSSCEDELLILQGHSDSESEDILSEDEEDSAYGFGAEEAGEKFAEWIQTYERLTRRF